jgi:hypothetical protein
MAEVQRRIMGCGPCWRGPKAERAPPTPPRQPHPVRRNITVEQQAQQQLQATQLRDARVAYATAGVQQRLQQRQQQRVAMHTVMQTHRQQQQQQPPADGTGATATATAATATATAATATATAATATAATATAATATATAATATAATATTAAATATTAATAAAAALPLLGPGSPTRAITIGVGRSGRPWRRWPAGAVRTLAGIGNAGFGASAVGSPASVAGAARRDVERNPLARSTRVNEHLTSSVRRLTMRTPRRACSRSVPRY